MLVNFEHPPNVPPKFSTSGQLSNRPTGIAVISSHPAKASEKSFTLVFFEKISDGISLIAVQCANIW